jgi:hypothetical protein
MAAESCFTKTNPFSKIVDFPHPELTKKPAVSGSDSLEFGIRISNLSFDFAQDGEPVYTELVEVSNHFGFVLRLRSGW